MSIKSGQHVADFPPWSLQRRHVKAFFVCIELFIRPVSFVVLLALSFSSWRLFLWIARSPPESLPTTGCTIRKNRPRHTLEEMGQDHTDQGNGIKHRHAYERRGVKYEVLSEFGYVARLHLNPYGDKAFHRVSLPKQNVGYTEKRVVKYVYARASEKIPRGAGERGALHTWA